MEEPSLVPITKHDSPVSCTAQINEPRGPDGMDEVKKAYEFTLDKIGSDIGAGPLWQEYIAFLQVGILTGNRNPSLISYYVCTISCGRAAFHLQSATVLYSAHLGHMCTRTIKGIAYSLQNGPMRSDSQGASGGVMCSRQGLANTACDLSVQVCICYGLDRSIDCVAWIGVGNEWSWLHRDLPWDPPLSRRCSPGAWPAKRRPSG